MSPITCEKNCWLKNSALVKYVKHSAGAGWGGTKPHYILTENGI